MKAIYIFFILLITQNGLAEVTWQQQAERLQKISTALTESIPVSTPVGDKKFDAFLDLSLLPKVNSQVGSKIEETDKPPIHGIPSLRWNHHFHERFATRLWIGALPSFLAAPLTDHTVNQYLMGIEGQAKFLSHFFASFGYQLSVSSIKGSITAEDHVDEVDSIAGIIYSGVGQNTNWGFWSVNVGARRNDSEFYIEEDETTYKFSDQLEDSSLPLFTQATIGTSYKSFTLALSQLYVPRRLMMPKLSLIYSW
jgi:hypothetical protein